MRTSARGPCVISNGSYLRYDRFNVTDDLNRSIIFTGLSFICPSLPIISFYSYVFFLFCIRIYFMYFSSNSSFKVFILFFFFNNSSHAYVNLTRSTIWPRSIAFSRQRFYNSFFTLLRNLLSVNEHTSQTSCSAVSRETGRRGRLAESGHADDTRKTQRFLPPTSPIIIAPTTHLSINFFFLRTLFILINFYR